MHCKPTRGSYRISLKKFCRKDYGRPPAPTFSPCAPHIPFGYSDPCWAPSLKVPHCHWACPVSPLVISLLPPLRCPLCALPLQRLSCFPPLPFLLATGAQVSPEQPAPSQLNPAPLSSSPQRCRWRWVRAARRVACGRASRWPCLPCSGVARSAHGAGAAHCGCPHGMLPAAAHTCYLVAATCCWVAGQGPQLGTQEAEGPGSAPLAGASCCPGATRGRGAFGDCSAASGVGVAGRPEPVRPAGAGRGATLTSRRTFDQCICLWRSLCSHSARGHLSPHPNLPGASHCASRLCPEWV